MEILEFVDGDNFICYFYYTQNERVNMKLTIIRIEEDIVACELEDGSLLDIARRWIPNDVKDGDIIEFDVNNKE